MRVLLSMRDDFLMRCHDHEGLRTVFDGLVPLGAPSGDALRRALVEPARAEGFRFEEGLADEMLAAVEGERGALPLLAFSVARLWSERERGGRLLTRAAYEQTGGVAGALAQHAEETLERIGDARQALVREIFRNLVTAEGTRASVDREELLSAFAERRAAEEVLDELVDARLLTTYEVRARDGDRRYRVEIIHESLLRAWPRLVRWQAQDAEGSLLRDQLRQAAHLWDEKGRPADLLWSGTSFREFALWRERYPGALTALEEQFARAMVSRVESRRRLRARGRRRAFAALLLVLVVIGVLLRRTNRALERSVVDQARARASKLVALGRLELGNYPTAALAYARKSLETADTIEARLLALEALWRGPVVSVLRHGIDCSRVAWSPDGAWVACSGFTPRAAVLSMDGTVRAFDVQPAMADARSTVPRGTPPELLTWLPGDDRVRDLSLDGRELRSYPGEVHHLRLLPDGGFATFGPAGPGRASTSCARGARAARGRRSSPAGSPARACDSTSPAFARWTSTRGCASWRTAGRTACIGSPSGRPVARTPSSDGTVGG